VPAQVRTTWPAFCARKPLSRRAVLKYRGLQRRWTQHWRWRVASGSVLCVRLRAEAHQCPSSAAPDALLAPLVRAAKTARLRQAQEEAAAEVAAYKAQREEAYKKLDAGVRLSLWVVPPSVCDAHHDACVGVSRAHTQSLTHGVHTRVAQHAGDAGSVQKQMEEEGATSINAVNAAVAAKKAEVVDLLVGYATKVNA